MNEDKTKMFRRKKVTNVGNLPAILFKAKTDAHISHLLQRDKTLASHNAFSYFYETIGGSIDKFVETYMAKVPVQSIVVESSSVIVNPIKYFENLYSQVQKQRRLYQEPYLLAQIDVIDEVIMQTLYMFKYIKS